MPTYRIRCLTCSAFSEVYRRVVDRDSDLFCKKCLSPAERVLTAAMIAADCFTEYVSPGTGRIISSPSARADDLKRSGAILAEPGIEKDVARNKAENIEKSFSPVAAGIDSIVTQLVNTGKLES
jgi:hypothetical protein